MDLVHFLAEASEGKNLHLEHLEDQIFNKGVSGTREAILFLRSVRDMLSGHAKTPIFITTKFDGAPAIFAGVNPENGKFFVGTKSVFIKQPRVNYTPEDIEKNHGEFPGLVKVLKIALQYLPELGITGVWQGDVLFTREMLKETVIDGEKYLTFQPNTIVYAVPYDSQLSRTIQRAQIGIVWHTQYSGDKLSDMKAAFLPNINQLNVTPDVWYRDAKFIDASGVATFTEAETAYLNNILSAAGTLFQRMDGKLLNYIASSNLYRNQIKTFNNAKIRAGQPIGDSRQYILELMHWVEQQANKNILDAQQAPTRVKREAAKTAQLNFYKANFNGLISIFDLLKYLTEAKTFIINKLKNVKGLGTFVRTEYGLKVTAPEGFVAIDHEGKAVKLVDRLEFSKINFNANKNWDEDVDLSSLPLLTEETYKDWTPPVFTEDDKHDMSSYEILTPISVIKRISLRRESAKHHLPPDINTLLVEKAANPATIMGRSMGLQYLGFGYWGRNHVATHKENEDKTWLDPLDKKQKIIASDKYRQLNLKFVKASAGHETIPQTHAYQSDSDYTYKIRSAMQAFQHTSMGTKGKTSAEMSAINRYDLKKLIADSHDQYSKLNDDEKAGISAYTGSHYGDINRNLRRMASIIDNKPDKEDALASLDEPSRYHKGLDGAFRKFRLPQEVVVYRGIGDQEAALFDKNKIVDVQQYLSTSISVKKAKDFGSDSMLVIRVPKGHSAIFAAGVSGYESENEVILDRGMQLKLIRKETKIPGGMKGDIAAEAIRRIQNDKNNYKYQPTRDEIMKQIGELGYRINKVYVTEIVGNRKAVPTRYLTNFKAFLKKYDPERIKREEEEKRQEEEDFKQAMAEKEKAAKEAAEAQAKATANKQAAQKRAGTKYFPVKIPNALTNELHFSTFDDLPEYTKDHDNWFYMSFDPTRPGMYYTKAELAGAYWEMNNIKGLFRDFNDINIQTGDYSAHGLVIVKKGDFKGEEYVPYIEVNSDNTTEDQLRDIVAAAKKLSKAQNTIIKIYMPEKYSLANDWMQYDLEYIHPDGKITNSSGHELDME